MRFCCYADKVNRCSTGLVNASHTSVIVTSGVISQLKRHVCVCVFDLQHLVLCGSVSLGLLFTWLKSGTWRVNIVVAICHSLVS